MKRFTVSPYTGPARKRFQMQRMNLSNPFYTTGWKFNPATFTSEIKINPVEFLEPARVYPKPIRQKFIVVPSREGQIVPRKGIETTHPLGFENHFLTTGADNRPQTYNALLQSAGVSNVEMADAIKYSKWLGELSNAGIKDMTPKRKEQLKNLYGSDVAEALALGDQRIFNAVKNGEIAPGISIASQIGLNRAFMSKRLQAALFALKSFQDKAKQFEKLRHLQQMIGMSEEEKQNFKLTKEDEDRIKKLSQIVKEELQLEQKQMEERRKREAQNQQKTTGPIGAQPIGSKEQEAKTGEQMREEAEAIMNKTEEDAIRASEKIFGEKDSNIQKPQGKAPVVPLGTVTSATPTPTQTHDTDPTRSTLSQLHVTGAPSESKISVEPQKSEVTQQVAAVNQIPVRTGDAPLTNTATPLGEQLSLVTSDDEEETPTTTPNKITIPSKTRFYFDKHRFINIKNNLSFVSSGDLDKDVSTVVELLSPTLPALSIEEAETLKGKIRNYLEESYKTLQVIKNVN